MRSRTFTIIVVIWIIQFWLTVLVMSWWRCVP